MIAIHVRYLFDIFVSKGQFWLLGKNNNLHVQGTEFARYRWQTQNATILTELYVNRESRLKIGFGSEGLLAANCRP